ncbi:hypothetical protein WQ54_07870 [Bacillus sp. SA1-12]|uniref:hypothetical protein n=1 Tax=Bacillus sp. SA1-12 TaxID=1455638 RepID=UPI0006264BC8|nr:hypothetical protein [Bacillus sp. SA1-12]KKI92784.1 hypothetical protein WQ54_07870 [Bacillus sp. SA1-12]
MNNIYIKFKIFEEELEELKLLNKSSFDRDYGQLYGNFTMVFNGVEYPSYPSLDSSLEETRLYSEPILTHLNNLIDATNSLETDNFIAILSPCDVGNWLIIERKLSKISFSHVKLKERYYNSNFNLNKAKFINSKEGLFKDIEIDFNNLRKEIKTSCLILLGQIEQMNKDILDSKSLQKIKSYIKT